MWSDRVRYSAGHRFFPGMYREADGVDDIRRAVREQLRKGARPELESSRDPRD
jgi:hypothetical protein